ncbi:Serine/threonine-protein kinase PknA [Luteitalea pratensis]|uniref:Serine/threonine-protein kinase PknA n=1 Tax=Luteitalea pratensis TaxID=1855912 RepID=A0A143PNF7_LUTPR|nr:protein kinase [Luteitalea pratensis]AMY09304.1 Serine/threonine-protein kinase PknA [Luteitalea pratensis]
MSSDWFRLVEALYHAAHEAPAEERAALLARADPELRHQVESLLSDRTGAEFLDRPVLEHARDLLEGPVPVTLDVGARLGPYSIDHKLGEGGMGEVFRAIDTRLGRAVAIKITREEFSARFEREARAIAALNHPNICTVHDVGANYLVMELVEGETLAARLKRGALPLHTTLPYASQIVAAGRGACQGHRSPRSQTGQHHDRQVRHQGAGFRAGEIGRRRDGERQPAGDGHTRLHGTRAA